MYKKLQQDREEFSVRESSLMFGHSTTVLLLVTALLLIIPPTVRPSSLSDNFLLSPEDQYDVEVGLAEQNILQQLKSRIRILKKRDGSVGNSGKIRLLKMSDPFDYKD